MEEITLAAASKITSPNPLTLVCTLRPDGGTNLAAVSWWTYLSYHPNMVCFAMAKTSYSGERVRETDKVIITVPGSEIADIAMKCGMTTGHKIDKVAELGIELKDLPETDIKVPVHTALAIQATLKEFIETGDHYLYICDVEHVYGDDGEQSLFAWNGYAEAKPAKQA